MPLHHYLVYFLLLLHDEGNINLNLNIDFDEFFFSVIIETLTLIRESNTHNRLSQMTFKLTFFFHSQQYDDDKSQNIPP
jgi:hypothetical protein